MPIPQQAKKLIEDWRLGFVASADGDGRPNLSPKGTFIVVDDTTIAFGEMRSPATMRNIGARPEVEINFVDVLTRRGFRFRGNTRSTKRGEAEFEEFYPAFETIWGPELGSLFNAIVFVDVETCKPLQSPAYETGASEAELRAQWLERIVNLAGEEASA